MKRKGTVRAALNARPALVTMTMMMEYLKRTMCVLLRALRGPIEECQIARLKLQIQNTPIPHHPKTLAFNFNLSDLVLDTLQAFIPQTSETAVTSPSKTKHPVSGTKIPRGA